MGMYSHFYILILFLQCLSLEHLVLCFTFTNPQASFIHYKQWDVTRTGVLRFRFKTKKDYGLLMYSDNSQRSSEKENFITMRLHYGKVQVFIQFGVDDYMSKRKIELGNNLGDLKWHSVEVRRNSRDLRITEIKVDDEVGEIINDGQYKTIELNSGLYFGGISKDIEDKAVHGRIKLQPRLVGCIDNVEFNTGEDATPKPQLLERSYNVTKGCRNACKNQICRNYGRCINGIMEATCDCAGTGFDGATCNEEAEVLTFSGKEYIASKVPERLGTTPTNHIAFRFKTTELEGLIMYGRSQNDHLMLEIHSGYIRFSIDLGGGYHLFRVNTAFNDGVWHRVQILRTGRDVSILVDGKYGANATTPRMFSNLDFRDSNKLYFGGHPYVSSLDETNSNSKKNFSGCLQHIFFNKWDVVYDYLRTKGSGTNNVGTIGKKCPVQRVKSRNDRNSPDSNTSDAKLGGNEIPEQTNPSSPPNAVKSFTNDSKKLSRDSVTWIVVGLVCGGIVLFITVVFIVYNVRNRYSGVFLSSQAKSRYHHGLKTDGSGTYFTPRIQNPIKPHLV